MEIHERENGALMMMDICVRSLNVEKNAAGQSYREQTAVTISMGQITRKQIN